MVVCRYYEAKYPSPGDIVMAKIAQISDDEIGAYVKLEEYGGIDGMIPLSELSRRRIRSVQKLLRVGSSEPMAVLRVDQDKGYIDLSKKTVSAEEVQACQDRVKMSRKVHTIVTHMAEKRNVDPQEYYEKFVWPLYAKYGHAYSAFKVAVSDPQAVFGQFNLDPALLDELMVDISRHMKPQRAKLHAKIDVRCFSFEGIEAIRRALRAAQDTATEQTPLSIRLIAPPEYVITTISVNPDEDIKLMNRAIEAAEKVLKDEGGALKVLVSPRQVTEHEEKELQDLMHRAERENAEVSGDDESDGDGY
ncbi:hypothetical protein LPJ77_003023 [Coemansia sp. RSA 2523]|nr:hypothetical protein LPJ54_002593 [Coemansia sp. RSA 1824]KAJ1783803.1 hypothetical protein LPJ62_004887 [Coemansia sp. RSA 2167]KAJ1807415.1 hypothetical protein LPJ77_003023 [Coemansia sp. RSA 2523]KAJ2138486.1 hypothetical protein J3F82_005929 [Coemansia sp. RSA 637]KAJ2166974.1 hypothetical protein GGH15_002420 [Coemansia sp. RSA 562]KAJ2175409.1 hypothetical protein GGF45_003870 [Coemansia sp. RSA 551]KAJ2188922.1 hypothetical protein EV181_001927 [Coemansia sp. RSA 532]KAJ2200273.1 